MKVQYQLADDTQSLRSGREKIKDEKDADVDFKRFDHLADAGETGGSVKLRAPVLARVTKMQVSLSLTLNP